MSGVEVRILFHVTRGGGVFLVGNQILPQSYQRGLEHLRVIPPNVRNLPTNELCFRTYTEPTSPADRDAVRTYIFVGASKTMSFRTFFTSISSFVSSDIGRDHLKWRFSHEKIPNTFASRLHEYSHLPLEDKKTLCLHVDVMTPFREQALRKAATGFSSCKQTGRAANCRKISFARILGSFNKHLQLELFFAKEFDNVPIFHNVDVHSGF